MCGFVGFTGDFPGKAEVLKDMMDTIVHRGPNDAGTYIGDRVAMGFRRLSIVDLQMGGQPLFNEDKTLVLTFNGEIYNFMEIREELVKRGHTFTTHTDSEVLIHGYEEYGTDLLSHLRGMFAFVLYDGRRDQLFGARDHFGIKPFYYNFVETNGKRELLYGSEIKSFLKHPDFHKEVNRDALKPYLTFQYSSMDETFFKGVFKLPPAHYFTYQNGTMVIERYWEPKFDEQSKSEAEFIEDIRDVVEDSVKAHEIADVPIGAFLSGGVDSSYVTSVMMPQETFSVGFAEEKFNESNLAKELSDILKIENIQKIITPDECFEAFPTIQYHMDEPQSNPSSVPLYFLAKLAREHVTVVLSGEGADELFAGYEWYDAPEVLRKYRKLPAGLRRLMANAVKGLPHFKGKNFLVKGGAKVEDYFIGQAMIFEEREAKQILNEPYQHGPSIKEITGKVYDRVKDKDDLTKMQYLDLNLWMPGDILLKADKMSMAHSLELRVPFLDKEVMAVAGSIPAPLRVNEKNTKYVFREAANKSIPSEWANRTKKGFPVPIRNWLREEKYYTIVKEHFTSDYAKEFFDTQKLMDLLDEHYSGKKNNGRKVWTVFTFLVWYKKFFIEL